VNNEKESRVARDDVDLESIGRLLKVLPALSATSKFTRFSVRSWSGAIELTLGETRGWYGDKLAVRLHVKVRDIET
jgi:hypothetical protein